MREEERERVRAMMGVRMAGVRGCVWLYACALAIVYRHDKEYGEADNRREVAHDRVEVAEHLDRR